MSQLVAPFPYFGGKRIIASAVWERFDGAQNYVEPFFGSGAVLLSRETPVKTETVNDADGLLVNTWRAIKADPGKVAEFADWPVTEADLSARHAWLVGRRDGLTQTLEADPDWYDAKAAGWWVWGACAWIGSGWCSGNGPWHVENGELRQLPHLSKRGQGINRKLPHLGGHGRGINRKLPHLGDHGRGINRKLPHLGDHGRGEFIRDWFGALSARLRDVRVACGDWSRVLSASCTWRHGKTAVFLDPPYDDGAIDYAVGGRIAADVRAWAIEHGSRSDMMIALCGYSEHDALADAGWSALRWKAHGGYSAQDGENANAARETIWFSPACLAPRVQLGIGGAA